MATWVSSYFFYAFIPSHPSLALSISEPSGFELVLLPASELLPEPGAASSSGSCLCPQLTGSSAAVCGPLGGGHSVTWAERALASVWLCWGSRDTGVRCRQHRCPVGTVSTHLHQALSLSSHQVHCSRGMMSLGHLKSQVWDGNPCRTESQRTDFPVKEGSSAHPWRCQNITWFSSRG